MRMIKRIFSLEFLLLPFYTYKLVELFVFKNTNTPTSICIRLILTSFLVPLVFITIIFLSIYYELIELYLRYKHGNNFYAMLDGCDRIWVVKSPSKNVINVIYAIVPNDNPNLSSELLQFFVDKYKIIAKTHPRFTSVIKSFLGLQYYHKVDLDIYACVKYFDEYANTADFYNLTEDYCNKELPKGDTYLWEFYVGRKLITWHDGTEILPLMVRYHHSLGDGVSLVTLMTTHLLQDGVEIMRKKCETYKAILTKPKNNTKESAKSNPGVKIMKLLQKKFYYPTLSAPEKDNLLHGPEISGKKHMICCWEKPDANYVNKVKKIKNYYKMAFADVISTSISAALCEHFSKFSKITTPNILTMNPYFLMSPDFDKLVQFNKENIPITKLGNKFAMGFTQMPIDLDVDNNTIIKSGNNNCLKVEDNELLSRLYSVHKINDRLKNALDFSFCYWQMRMFAGLPLAVGKMLLLANDASLSVSNVPGNTTSRLTNGCILKDTFVFGNNYGKVGVSITLFTYDEEFRISLLIDKSLIPERKDAQLLGDGIFKYIDALAATLPS
ncbi:uncharacterized protein [Atheta coriaria]|uniref:uncharacterized protein n=1 Tax=Dalotia coriaria TaxID=877792 RepID=UPI0031F3A180